MGFHFSTSIFHFYRRPPLQNLLLLKTQVLISPYSTVSAENPFYRKIFVKCSKEKALRPGRQAHARMIVSGFKPTVFASNCLLQIYIKCSLLECAVKVFDRMSERSCVSWNTMISGYSINGKMELAQSLFDLLPERDVVSWTSLISGYLHNGNCLKSVEVFVMMGRDDDVAYNATTLSVLLKACTILKNNVIGVQVHGAVVKLGFECDVVTATAMLDMYAKCNMLDDSKRFFDRMPVRNLVSWSAIVAGNVQNDKLESGIELFKEMLREGGGVGQSVYASVFKSCAGLSDSRLGSQLHGHALKSNFGANTIVGSAIVNMYAKCDNLLDARKVFNLLPNHELHSYTALIAGYARGDRGFEGMQLFMQLLKFDLGFNEVSLSVVFSACAVSKGLMVGTQIHGLAIKTPFHDYIYVATAILDMYGKCGALQEARRIFDELEKRDVVAWTSMFCAYADHGYGNEALQVFEKMVVENIIPDYATFTGVLHACAHSGLVDEALHYLYVMHSEYGVLPDLQHYSCVVDALGRRGRIIDAFKLIEDMHFEANCVIWRSLLSNCKMHRNVEVAEIAARSLLQLDPQDSSAYVLLSNIYASAGMWYEASEMRRIMTNSGVKKETGCSWIEVQGEVHMFLARDEAHPQFDEIYEKLDMIMAEIKSDVNVKTSSVVVLNQNL